MNALMSASGWPRSGEAPVAGADVTTGHDRFAEMLVCLPLVGITFLSKVALPLGSKQVALADVILFGCVAVGLATGRFRVRPTYLIFYLFTIAFLTGLQIFGSEPFSLSSMALLIAMHATYTVAAQPGLIRTDRQFVVFQNIMAIIALCGIAQFFLQFVIGSDAVFPIEGHMPDSILIKNFAYKNPLYFGSSVYRSNGIFLLEPSVTSQLAAISIIVELLFFRRILRLALLAGVMLVSYSGTGLIILASTLPIFVVRYRRYEILALGLLAIPLLFAVSDALQLDVFMRRASEFDSTQSSAFARFIGGFYLFGQYLLPNLGAALFGLGAGSAPIYADRATYLVTDVTWVKIFFEYGIIGGGLYFWFMGYCIFKNRNPVMLQLALAINFLLVGPLIPAVHGLILALLVWPSAEFEPEKVIKRIGTAVGFRPSAAQYRPGW